MKKFNKIFYLIVILSLFCSHMAYTANNLTPAGVTDLPEIDLASGNILSVMDVIKLLSNNDPNIRRIAAERLINYPKFKYKALDALIEAIIKEDNILTLNAMAKALVHPNINDFQPGRLHSDDLDALVKALQTTDEKTRETAAQFILARLTAYYLNTAQYQRIYKTLLKVIEINDDQLNQSAGHKAFIVGKKMYEHGNWTVEAVDILTFALRYAKDSSDRRYALDSLNAIAKDYLEHTETKDPDKMAIIYPKAIKALIYGLTDTEVLIPHYAKNYLKKYLYTETIIELINRLKKQEFNERALPLAAELLYYGGEKLINTDHDSLAIESLTHALNYGNESIRNNAAYAFADFNNKEIFKENRDTIVTFMNIAGNTEADYYLRWLSINHLGDAQVTEAVPVLTENFKEKTMQKNAAISLGKISTKEAVELLTKKAQKGWRWPRTRAAASAGLGYVKKPDKKIKRILFLNLAAFSVDVKTASLRSLGMTRDTKIIPHLRERLHSYNREIKLAALDALFQFDFKTSEAIEAIGTALKDKNGYVRISAVNKLSAYKSVQATELLLTALNDPDLGILSAAIKGITETLEYLDNSRLDIRVSEDLEAARKREASLMAESHTTRYPQTETFVDSSKKSAPLTISEFVETAKQSFLLAESL